MAQNDRSEGDRNSCLNELSKLLSSGNGFLDQAIASGSSLTTRYIVVQRFPGFIFKGKRNHAMVFGAFKRAITSGLVKEEHCFYRDIALPKRDSLIFLSVVLEDVETEGLTALI